jgi:hypothetical protein
MDILWKLEKEFPEHAFLPEAKSEVVQNALSVLENIVSAGAFFKWLGNNVSDLFSFPQTSSYYFDHYYRHYYRHYYPYYSYR